jgi:V/A-type H+/Na+-transporting ATPase subunit I
MNLPVKKIELILPKEDIKKTIDNLQSGGFLEIISNYEEEGKDFFEQKEDYKLRLSEVEFVLSFLKEFEEKESFAKNLILSFAPVKEPITREEIEKIASSQKIKDVVRKCALIEEKINKLKIRKEELGAKKDVVERFLGTTVFTGKKISKIVYFAGTINLEEKEDFLNKAKKKTFYIEEGTTTNSFLNFVLYYTTKEAHYFNELFKKYNVKEQEVFWDREPAKTLEEIKKELREIDLEISIQSKEAQKLVFFIPKLKALADWLSFELEKEHFLKKTGKTKKYIVFKAWIPVDSLEKVKKIIQSKTPYYLIKEVPVDKDEKPPVVLRSKGRMGSFAVVTGVYGLPKEDEIDPTPYLAPFFIFYFALALSDSGYGLLLAALAFLGKKILKKANANKFFDLFIFCGLLTAVIGLFVGTIFGESTLEALRIADPLSDPIGALMFVLGLGFFQIFIGLVIGMVWIIKQGRFNEAISGNGASIVFFLGTAFFLLTDNINFMISGIISMLLLAFVFSKESSIFKRVGGVLGSIYVLTGFFGDVLSYSRILALGLATGIIASVINMIAVIFMEMIPIPGINLLIAGIILVVGHIGNLLINALGAFIHSARLQFVEFFSKFMEGGGRHFKPLSKKGRYVEIIN